MEFIVDKKYCKDIVIIERNPVVEHRVELTSRPVVEIQEQAVREVLISLGWTPPDQEATNSE